MKEQVRKVVAYMLCVLLDPSFVRLARYVYKTLCLRGRQWKTINIIIVMKKEKIDGTVVDCENRDEIG
jgi:hypothetical protein